MRQCDFYPVTIIFLQWESVCRRSPLSAGRQTTKVKGRLGPVGVMTRSAGANPVRPTKAGSLSNLLSNTAEGSGKEDKFGCS